MSTSGAAIAVESRLLRALSVLRWVLLINAVGLNLYRADDVQRPVGATACVVMMIVWTGYVSWAYLALGRRTPLLLTADLGVALALLVATPLVKGADFAATIPGFWIAGALMALGVWLHVSERHDHAHAHEAMAHEHLHIHDMHHQHAHDFPWDGREPHSHLHQHEPMVHSHPHYPDLHHRHGH